MATDCTPPRTLIVAVTASVAVLITETVPSPWLATKTWLPSGVTAASYGREPTGIVAVTVSLEVSTTDTMLAEGFGTYSSVPAARAGETGPSSRPASATGAASASAARGGRRRVTAALTRERNISIPYVERKQKKDRFSGIRVSHRESSGPLATQESMAPTPTLRTNYRSRALSLGAQSAGVSQELRTCSQGQRGRRADRCEQERPACLGAY